MSTEYKINVDQLSDAARAVDVFQSYPRFSSSKTFSTDSSYIRGIFLLIIPWAVTGLLLVIIGIAFNVFVITRRGVAPGMQEDISQDDDNDGDEAKETRKALAAQEKEHDDYWRRSKTGRASLIFTAWLFASIFALVGMGLVANYGVRAALDGAIISTESFLEEFRLNVAEVLDFVRVVSKRVDSIPQGTGQAGVESLRERLDGLGSSMGNIDQFVKESVKTGQEIVDDFNTTRLVVNLCISLLLFAFFIALSFVFTTNLISVHSHVARVVLLILFLLPLGISWAMTGVLTSAGAISADLCVALRDYQGVVLDEKNSDATTTSKPPQDNVFIKAGLECPRASNGDAIDSLVQFLSLNFDSNQDIDVVTGLNNVLGSNQKEVTSALREAGEALENFSSCEPAARWAARMHYHMCSDFSGSVVASVLMLWLIFIALSVMLLLVFVVAMTGFAVAEFATAYEMLRIHGMPEPAGLDSDDNDDNDDNASDVEKQTLRSQLQGERLTSMLSQRSVAGGLRAESSFFGSATARERNMFYGDAVRRIGSSNSSNRSSGTSKAKKQTSQNRKYTPFAEVVNLGSRDQANFFKNSKD